MMNCKKFLTVALSFAGAMLFATAANAQSVVLGAGSSALFPTVGIAAVSPDPISGAGNPCGNHLWTGKNGALSATVNGIDPRSGTTAEPGSIFVAWDNSTTPTIVCAYLSVDSLVGQRLFFAQGASGNGTLQFATGTAASNLIAGFLDSDATVPGPVASLINGAHFNVAFTDIRPEDGQFAFFRAANAVASGGFGYNTGCSVAGTPIWSSFSNTNAQVDCFRISGTDPISAVAIPSSKTIPLGASPIIPFINNNGSIGAATNILAKTAEKFFSGQLGGSQSVFGTGVGNVVMAEIQREPLSGTYNTWEFQLVHARDGSAGDSTQEKNGSGLINPTPAQCFVGGAAFVACTNPMYINSGLNSQRYRAIGTGEMIKAVNGTTTVPTTQPDRLGYAFYSLGSFFITSSHLKYLTLQGVDALYSNYDTAGLFGTCSGDINTANFQCTTKLPSLANVAAGNYRVWSSLRAVVNTSAPLPPAAVTTLLHAAEDQAAYALSNPALSGINAANTNISAIADFVPNFSYPGGVETPFLKVFRSHYGISGLAANNGTNGPSAFCAADQAPPNCFEEGGDMAGVAFQIISDQSYFNATGSEFLTQIE
jgi:hypothetical protein